MIRKKISKLKKEEKSVLRIRNSEYQEVLISEKAYLDKLQDILRIYIRPIKKNKALNVNKTAINYLVGNLEGLFGFHQKFYEQLEKLRDHYLYPYILPLGDVIHEHSANLRTQYMTYTNNYIPRIETLSHLRNTNPKLHAFILEVSKNLSFLLINKI